MGAYRLPIRRTLLTLAGILAVPVLAAMVLLAAAVAPALAGYRAVPVTTTAFLPYLEPGSVMVQQPVPPAQLQPGDRISFSADAYGDRVFTHDVVSVTSMQGVVELKTTPLGDPTVWTWLVPPSQPVGRLVYVVPFAGRLLDAFSSPIVSIVPAMLGGLLLWWALQRPAKPADPRPEA